MEHKPELNKAAITSHHLLPLSGSVIFFVMLQILWLAKHGHPDEIYIRIPAAVILGIAIYSFNSLLIYLCGRLHLSVIEPLFWYVNRLFPLLAIGTLAAFSAGMDYYPILIPTVLFALPPTKNNKQMVFLIFLAAATPLLLGQVIEWKYNESSKRTVNLPRHMIFAHAGQTGKSGVFKPNSAQAVSEAARLGYYGVELDVHYIDSQLILAHDMPKDSNMPLLEDIFTEHNGELYYWLDFKNLKQLGNDDITRAGRLLSEYVHKFSLEGKVIVESTSHRAIGRLKSASPEIYTCYWLTVPATSRQWVFAKKYEIIKSRADCVSIAKENLTSKVLENFTQRQLNVFTLNNPAEVKRLFSEGVWIILSDINLKDEVPFAYRPVN